MRTAVQTVQELAITPDRGLTAAAVEASRARFGANVLTPLPRESLWKKFLEKFDEPIIKILLAAALLSLGTVALVAAVLPVPDRASRALMVRLHRYLGAGDALASALARAQADLRRGDDPAARVVAAGYVCLGAG